MKVTLALVGWLILGLAAAYGQALDPVAVQRASTEVLLSMPEPPLGFVMSKHPMVVDERLAGFQVQVLKEEAISRVVIQVETRDLTDRRARVAACKGYINGFAAGLQEQGFKLTDRKLPDLEKADFKTPVVVDLTLANAEGMTLRARKWLFFTTKGYDVTVLASDENDFKLLTEWAAQVQPAPARQGR